MSLKPLTPPDGLRTHYSIRMWPYYLHLVDCMSVLLDSDCWSKSPAHWDHYAVKTGNSISSTLTKAPDCIPPLAGEGEAIGVEGFQEGKSYFMLLIPAKPNRWKFLQIYSFKLQNWDTAD